MTLCGPEELAPTVVDNPDDYVSLRLGDKSTILDSSVDKPSETEGATLSCRLIYQDCMPCFDRWLQKGRERKFGPPHALLLDILGALNLVCGAAYVRVWLNGRCARRQTAVAGEADLDPSWEDDGCLQIGESFVLPLGACYVRRCATNCHRSTAR